MEEFLLSLRSLLIQAVMLIDGQLNNDKYFTIPTKDDRRMIKKIRAGTHKLERIDASRPP